MTDILETIREMVVGGKFKEIEEQVQQAVDSGTDLNLLINDALISAMDIVGKRFADGDIYVPEMLVSAKTMKLGLDIIKPLLQSGEAEHRGTIVMGTVKGDLHDIGKNLVTMMMEGAGFEVVDLGINTFAAEDPAVALAFQQKVARLERAVRGALEAADEADERLAYLRKAVLDTPEADAVLLAECQRLQTELDDILVQLRGDRTRSRRNVNTPPSISQRVFRIVGSQWETTSAPTKTELDGYTWAAEAFAAELARLKTLFAQLEMFEDQAEAAGAPAPGPVPIGRPIRVPVGRATLGRLFNVLGEPIDGQPMPDWVERHPIHVTSPPLSEQRVVIEPFVTGIKAIDLLRPGKDFDVLKKHGLACSMVSRSSPSRSITPGRKFSATMSALAASRLIISTALGSLRSSAMLRLLPLTAAQVGA